jgi:hypothetical protein
MPREFFLLTPARLNGRQGNPASSTSWSGISPAGMRVMSPWSSWPSPKLARYVSWEYLFHSLVNTQRPPKASKPTHSPPIPANRSMNRKAWLPACIMRSRASPGSPALPRDPQPCMCEGCIFGDSGYPINSAESADDRSRKIYGGGWRWNRGGVAQTQRDTCGITPPDRNHPPGNRTERRLSVQDRASGGSGLHPAGHNQESVSFCLHNPAR